MSKKQDKIYDVIVIGGGHAGCEAAAACATVGLKTLLISNNIDKIGHLSCNPAIGGLGKGHIVKEIDALGGFIGQWADSATIQVRTLNASKGPAVRATRAQIDRDAYMRSVKQTLHQLEHLDITEELVTNLLIEKKRCVGVQTILGQAYTAMHTLITVGTFLRGTIHIGSEKQSGGRVGDAAANNLGEELQQLGFSLQRFMTCTPPRLSKRSINFSVMEPQYGDTPPPYFHYRFPSSRLPQLPCYLTWTTAETQAIIEEHLHLSPMYNGAIPGTGPRYCPSIEDKIARFPDKKRHQIFVEPEGIFTSEYFPNGMPTGLPLDIQQAILRTIPGLEHSRIIRPGYAIEYDSIDPRQLLPTLQSKLIANLWFAGQVNGTSGYEEAAGQGMWAALNIIAKLRNLPAFLPKRNEAYLAVLIDDLVTKGTDEPYRLFTSRAEYRLLLRESNAALRLTELGHTYGTVQEDQWAAYTEYNSQLQKLLQSLETEYINPTQSVKDFFIALNESPPNKPVPVGEFFRRPAISILQLSKLWPQILDYAPAIQFEAEAIFTYAGYITRQEELVQRQSNRENTALPIHFDYTTVAGLDLEAREKLSAIKPLTIGQATRVPGISPAAIACIEIALKKLVAGK